MADELSAPLGRKSKSKSVEPGKKLGLAKMLPRIRFTSLPLTRMGFGLLTIIIIVIASRLVLVDDPQGGRPSAEVTISSNAGNNQIVAEVSADVPPSSEPIVPVTQSGGPSITTVGDDVPDSVVGTSAGVAALTEFGVLPDLVEETQLGPIPRTAPDGTTPFEAYARASVSANGSGAEALIAVIVTGMGLNEGGTLDAIERLPDNVTLGFVPYGRNLQRTTNTARTGGHELLLELPLEPFDYPENDPGPQTLLTGQPPRANLDRMFWLLARFGGYIGAINHMGARFTASAQDFNPVMEEMSVRGLGYVDDGSSNRSLAANLAQTNKVPFARANVQIDAVPSRAAINEALSELEKIAKENGQAVGVASALPVSVQAISDWARGLEDRGFLLVPVSAMMRDPD